MTENESRIVEWLLKPGNLSCAPAIKDVAEALAVSEAMIVKVSKLLGFSGFRNLRSALEDYFSQSEQVLPSELAFDEAPQDVVNKVFNITLRAIMEGQSIVNVGDIDRAARFFYQGQTAGFVRCRRNQKTRSVLDVQRPVFDALAYAAKLSGHSPHHDHVCCDVKASCRSKKNGAKIICITHSYLYRTWLLERVLSLSPSSDIEQANINMQKPAQLLISLKHQAR